MNPYTLLLWMTAGALAALPIGIYIDDLPFALLGGALLGWPASFAFTTRRRRWAAVATLFFSYLLAWKLVGPAGLLIALTCTGITLFMSAAILRELYNGSEVDAFLHHMRLLTGLLRGFHIVREGKSEVPSGDGPVFGPRLLIIKPDTAVILEQGSRHTQTLGPGITTTGPFESVKHIFNLHPQAMTFALPNVRTRDHLAITVKATLVAYIGVPSSIRTGHQSMNDPNDPQTATYDKYRLRLQRIYDFHKDWENAVNAEVESQIRSYCASHSLEELTDASHYQRLAANVVGNANKRVNKWGIRVERAIVECIEPTRSVVETIEEQWADGLRMKTASDAERAQAQGFADALKIIAMGYRAARAQGMSQDEINRLVLLRTIERVVSQPGLDLHLSAGIIGDLQDLRRALGLASH